VRLEEVWQNGLPLVNKNGRKVATGVVTSTDTDAIAVGQKHIRIHQVSTQNQIRDRL